eukprot:scaffold4707_cov164-Amphora_coffeaeformis.AAC.20
MTGWKGNRKLPFPSRRNASRGYARGLQPRDFEFVGIVFFFPLLASKRSLRGYDCRMLRNLVKANALSKCVYPITTSVT